MNFKWISTLDMLPATNIRAIVWVITNTAEGPWVGEAQYYHELKEWEVQHDQGSRVVKHTHW